jgi:hypothetical protein
MEINMFSRTAECLLVLVAMCCLPVKNSAAQERATAGESADVVTEQLFRQYVVGRGRIPTASVNAAIELVAARATERAFINTVLAEFEKSCDAENARTIKRNLLELMSKMLAQEGGRRWQSEQARRTGQNPAATVAKPAPSRQDDKVVHAESEMLARVIARGRQADRHEIDAFVLAVRQAHHPQGKQFLLDVLHNPPDPFSGLAIDGSQGKWPDNIGGTWRDAKFHAAIGLAELGEHAGVEWLIEQSQSNDFGVGSTSVSLWRAPHRKAAGGNLRESCLYALADLSGQPATDQVAHWKTWWAANKDQFEPTPVALKID